MYYKSASGYVGKKGRIFPIFFFFCSRESKILEFNFSSGRGVEFESRAVSTIRIIMIYVGIVKNILIKEYCSCPSDQTLFYPLKLKKHHSAYTFQTKIQLISSNNSSSKFILSRDALLSANKIKTKCQPTPHRR